MKTFQRQVQPGAVFFKIVLKDNEANYQNSTYNQLYKSQGGGFVRKAIVTRVQPRSESKKFVDKQFDLVPPPNYRMVRLFDLYKGQCNLFPTDEHESSYFQYAERYNSFMAESGVINYKYLKSLFITKTVNAQGYYQYFVKRNGEYYLEECDDFIPVHKQTWKPIFGLQLQHPYQIILFKAWAKEVNGIKNMQEALPFSFIEAFGLPEYQVFNFRKEKKFIQNQAVAEEYKRENKANFPLNKSQIVFIGRTVNNDAVRKIGLVPNTAAYKINKISQTDPKNKQNLFHVYSSLPCSWVGKYSPVYNSNLNYFPVKQAVVDLQRNFIITETQLLTYFNKFFVIPIVMDNPALFVVQDCFNIRVENKPIWLRVNIVQGGTLGLSIQMPKIKGKNNAFPQFRYFFTKKMDQKQRSRSHFREDLAGSKLEENMYITSNCDKWEYYLIDYVQGYENHSSKFAIVNPGQYVLFIHPQLIGTIRVRFDSHVRIQEPILFQPTPQQAKQIFDSTFFSISRTSSVEASFDVSAQEAIALNNSFEQLGYGSICIKTLLNAQHKVAMRVFPDLLKEAGLKLPQHYKYLQLFNDKQKNFVLISSNGRPQIIVLQRINNLSKSQIGQVFPPPGTVEFFKVKPNRMISTLPASNNPLLRSALGPSLSPPTTLNYNPTINQQGLNSSPNIIPNITVNQPQQLPNITVTQAPGIRNSNITDSIFGSKI